MCHSGKYKINFKSNILYLQKVNTMFWNFEESKSKNCIGNSCLIHSICFLNFDPKKILSHTLANNLNGFLSFDSSLNAFGKRCRSLQNKLTLAKVFLEIQAFFYKLRIAVYDKQKLIRKRKLKENERDNEFGSCNML